MLDLISRQAAIEHLKKRLYETALNNDTDYPYCEIADNRVSVWLDEVPTIEPKKARWHKRNNVNFSPFDGSSEYEFTCGWCGGTAESITNYCPNCGAKMRE